MNLPPCYSTLYRGSHLVRYTAPPRRNTVSREHTELFRRPRWGWCRYPTGAAPGGPSTVFFLRSHMTITCQLTGDTGNTKVQQDSKTLPAHDTPSSTYPAPTSPHLTLPSTSICSVSYIEWKFKTTSHHAQEHKIPADNPTQNHSTRPQITALSTALS
jgi:hypothetical protein